MAVSLDVAATIAEFLADVSSTSIELPHMTTGQRKSTKKLLEQYAELRCESFGFGADRQLHVFKKGASDVRPEPEDGDSSMVKMSHQEKLDAASPDRSTAASSEASPIMGSSSADSPVQSMPEIALPGMHAGVQVRNTFIHYESAPIDERAVKSMPHGMFKQCIFWEASQREAPQKIATSSFEPEAEPLASPVDGEHVMLSFGALVVVEGLVKAPAFNGCTAVVQDFDEALGRYNILLPSAAGCQHAKVKADNLRVVLPCP